MSEYTQYYEAFCLGRWATEDPDTCRCHGSGWALSEVDTCHKCPIHWRKGMLHPDEADALADFEAWAKANPAEHALMLAEAAAKAEARVIEAEDWHVNREAWAVQDNNDIPF